MVIVPTTELYIPQYKAATSSGSGGLSTGAIVGIAVGATAGAAALAGAVWAGTRRRRQRLAAAAPVADAALESGKGCILDPASSGSSYLASVAYKFGSAHGSSAPPSPAPGNTAELPAAAGSGAGGGAGGGAGSSGDSPRGRAGAPLAELLERVASVEAAAASILGTSAALSEHRLLSAEDLPPRLREFLVPPSAVTYCRWPNGQPQEIGAGATSRVYKAMLNGEGQHLVHCWACCKRRSAEGACMSWHEGNPSQFA